MKHNISKQPAAILSILIFTIAIMLSGNAFAEKPDYATQAELDAAIATVNSKISDITPPVRAIGDVLSDNSIVFWVDETGQHGLAAYPSDDANSNWWGAKELAENHGPGWRLPTKYEWSLLYLQKDVVGSFAGDYYWSSTEFDANAAWFLYFASGLPGPSGKDNVLLLSVRAVRAF